MASLGQTPPRVAFLDPRTGVISREWYAFFNALFERTGGNDALSNDDLTGLSLQQQGNDYALTMLGELDQAFNLLPPSIFGAAVDDLSPPAIPYQQDNDLTPPSYPFDPHLKGLDLLLSGVCSAAGYYDTSKIVDATAALTTATITAFNTYFTGTAGASFAITLPSASAAIDGQKITIMSTDARAATTWISTGATFVGAPAALVANTPVVLHYHHATTQWFISA